MIKSGGRRRAGIRHVTGDRIRPERSKLSTGSKSSSEGLEMPRGEEALTNAVEVSVAELTHASLSSEMGNGS